MIFYSKLWGAGPCLFVGTHAIKFSELKGPNLVGIQLCCTSSEYKGVRILPGGVGQPKLKVQKKWFKTILQKGGAQPIQHARPYIT